MTRTEPTTAVLRSAYKEGFERQPYFYGSHLIGLRAVYDAGVAAERERCARIAETEPSPDLTATEEYDCGYSDAALDIATAIRADDQEEDR